jgi:hypothetical protein
MGQLLQYMHTLACDMHALACDVTGQLHALTAWDLKFQVCLKYTFTLATLLPCLQEIVVSVATEKIMAPQAVLNEKHPHYILIY